MHIGFKSKLNLTDYLGYEKRIIFQMVSFYCQVFDLEYRGEAYFYLTFSINSLTIRNLCDSIPYEEIEMPLLDRKVLG